MSWLQKRPQASDPAMFYTVGQSKTILLVGLGNPGAEYDLTRHNVGFATLDEFVRKTDGMEQWIVKKDLKCQMSTGRMGESRVIAIKPTTFMNLSGDAVQATCHFYKIHPDHIAVIHDELDIDFGQIRLRKGGSSAGHNGIKSISGQMGEDYNRVRIGVGPKKPARIASEKFVLQQFSKEEQVQLNNMNQEVSAVLTEYIFGGQFPHDTRNFLV